MIDVKTYFFNPEIISIIEEKYGVKYICETCIKTKGYWRNEPSLIFYSKKPHPEGSNYLSVSRQNNSFVLSNGISATEPFAGVQAKNGEIIYSRFRHDFRTSSDKSVFIDGGREYTRIIGDQSPSLVQLIIAKDKVVQV